MFTDQIPVRILTLRALFFVTLILFMISIAALAVQFFYMRIIDIIMERLLGHKKPGKRKSGGNQSRRKGEID